MLAYNHERFIAQALQSALDQDVDFEYEIVVGDDCSPDRTREVISDFQRRYPGRIIALFHKRNKGANRNFAAVLAACRGQYVCPLEGDDYWTTPSKLQTQVDFLDAHPGWAICCTRAVVLNDPELKIQRVRSGHVFPSALGDQNEDSGLGGLLPTAPKAAGTYSVDDLLLENFIPTCTVMYRRSFMPRLPSWFFRFRIGDLPLHAITAEGHKIELLNECSAVYRVHAAGAWSTRDRADQVLESARMMAALCTRLGRHGSEAARVRAARLCFYLSSTACQQGKRWQTFTHLIGCLQNGGYKISDVRPNLRGLVWFALFGSWLPALSKFKRSIRTPARRSD